MPRQFTVTAHEVTEHTARITAPTSDEAAKMFRRYLRGDPAAFIDDAPTRSRYLGLTRVSATPITHKRPASLPTLVLLSVWRAFWTCGQGWPSKKTERS